jgi:hypothetical protein
VVDLSDPFAVDKSVNPSKQPDEYTHFDIVRAVDRLAGQITHLDEWLQEQKQQQAILMHKIDTVERFALQCVTPDSIDRGLAHLKSEVDKEISINKIIEDKAIADNAKALTDYQTVTATAFNTLNNTIDTLRKWVYLMAGGIILGGALLAAGVIDLRNDVAHTQIPQQTKTP